MWPPNPKEQNFRRLSEGAWDSLKKCVYLKGQDQIMSVIKICVFNPKRFA